MIRSLIFYFLLFLVNISALVMITITHITGPSPRTSHLKVLAGYIALSVIISLITGIASALLSYLFKAEEKIFDMSWKAVFIYQSIGVFSIYFTERDNLGYGMI